MKLVHVFLMMVGVLALVPIISALLAVPVYYLWNGLIPNLFHGPAVTFMQAWGLLILSGFMFKNSTSSSK